METDEEIRSEWVHDYLEEIPSWLIRWGTLVIFLVVLTLLSISWLIRYPTIVPATFRLTSQNAPKAIVTKTDGRLVRLFVKDNETVGEGQTLAFMEATAKHEEVLKLKTALLQLQQSVNLGYFGALGSFPADRFQALGELQMAFQGFMQTYTPTLSLFGNGYYQQRRAFLQDEITDLRQNLNQYLEEYRMFQRDGELAQREFEIQRKLYREKVIATLEYQREESKYIVKQLPLRQLAVTINNNRTAKTQKQKEIADLDRQTTEQKTQFAQALNSLLSSVEDWQKRYLLTASMNGQVHLLNSLQENQTLRAGTELMYIGGHTGQYFGEARIPQANAGKVLANQPVLIKFQGYPFEEYGVVQGRVQSVSKVPTPDNQFFVVTVALPKGLQTNTNQTLTYKNGMEASAEIITEDLRLIERIFYQLRKVIEKH